MMASESHPGYTCCKCGGPISSGLAGFLQYCSKGGWCSKVPEGEVEEEFLHGAAPAPVAAIEVQRERGHTAASNMTLEFLPRPLIMQYPQQVERILIAVGRYMCNLDDTAEEWAAECYVSDQSHIGCFGLDPDELQLVEVELGLTMEPDDKIFAIAARMAGVN